MKSKRLLVDLIEYLELFEGLVPDAEAMSLGSFITFVDSMLAEGKGADAHGASPQSSPEVWIARYLSLLHRYSRTYIKKALAQSEYLQTEEEYTYLVCLMAENGLTKTELNNLNGMEKTSGSEVIRRLRRHELIEEHPDERDKRSVCVFITPKGRRELAKVFPQLNQAATLVSAPLADRQRNLLHYLLMSLTEAHGSLIPRAADSTLGELLALVGDSKA